MAEVTLYSLITSATLKYCSIAIIAAGNRFQNLTMMFPNLPAEIAKMAEIFKTTRCDQLLKRNRKIPRQNTNLNLFTVKISKGIST